MPTPKNWALKTAFSKPLKQEKRSEQAYPLSHFFARYILQSYSVFEEKATIMTDEQRMLDKLNATIEKLKQDLSDLQVSHDQLRLTLKYLFVTIPVDPENRLIKIWIDEL